MPDSVEVSLVSSIVAIVFLAVLLVITYAKLEIAEGALQAAQSEALKYRMEASDCRSERAYESLFDVR